MERRGRSPGPAVSRHGSDESFANGYDAAQPISKESTPARNSKRRKRSELSPSSKQTHSIIEKERREAMNEKFSELAAQVPELVEALASGKKPTKGEIVKASIHRHQQQDRRIQELQLELQSLRASNTLQGISVEQGFAASLPPVSMPAPAPTFAMQYQVQTSQPIMPPHESGDVWIGQLLQKANDHLVRNDVMPPITATMPDSSAPVSPFKQTSMMSDWNMASMPQPTFLPASAFGHAVSFGVDGVKIPINNGTLDQLGRTDFVSGSAIASPTFTSSDTDSSFSSEAIDPSLDDKRFLAESMGFEPFPLNSTVPEQTPLASLIGLPPADHQDSTTMTAATTAKKVGRKVTLSRNAAKRGRQSEPSTPAFSTLLATTLPVNK
ncbi:hypothetical protein BCV70DRAFT_165571 [Testicularia cyperi]|uniref:BHLH domain-containing protein n=1 Tax=Testicularia cyperi TaxID=1882483 RepID=A0A317XJT4_9BASI|nr:hypothetical protein BCV70DRAFT_165571 [Testicularia cyperi]